MAIQPSLTDRSACASRSGSGRPQSPAYCSSSSCVSPDPPRPAQQAAAEAQLLRLRKRSGCAKEGSDAPAARKRSQKKTSSAASPPESRCTSSRMNQDGGLPASASTSSSSCCRVRAVRVTERKQLRRQLRRGGAAPGRTRPNSCRPPPEKLPEQTASGASACAACADTARQSSCRSPWGL